MSGLITNACILSHVHFIIVHTIIIIVIIIIRIVRCDITCHLTKLSGTLQYNKCTNYRLMRNNKVIGL